jgi:hypothetical protein
MTVWAENPAVTNYDTPNCTVVKISPDNTCGGTNGYTCPTGSCCSQYGYW